VYTPNFLRVGVVLSLLFVVVSLSYEKTLCSPLEESAEGGERIPKKSGKVGTTDEIVMSIFERHKGEVLKSMSR
jgi:hypothetical protein